MPDAPIPSSEAVARDLLPGVRMAARERYGPLRMMVISPILLIIIQIAGEFLIQWIAQWLSRRDGSASANLTLMALNWEDKALPEVRHSMNRIAAGDTGE